MNIARHIERAAHFLPERTAILFEGKSLSYGELNEQASRLANALQANGVERGDRVALHLPNIPEFAVCYCAILKAGAIAVSVNSIFKSDEVAYVLNDAGAKIVFTTEDLLTNISRQDCRTVEQIVICEGGGGANPSLRKWLERGAAAARAMDMHPDEAAALLYTSGTTGFPKGATLTHGNVVSNMYATAHHAGYRTDDRLVLFLPLFHVFGQNFILNAAFTACATVVLHRRFVMDQMLESIQRDRITMFLAVPTVYINLLSQDLSKVDLSSIRYDFSAAATMPEEISRRWTDRFGRRIFEGYGLTECSPFACYNHDFRHKFGSVGSAVENCELKIVDEHDEEVARGELGEICVRGPGVMKGYWGKPEESAQALRNGWLHTGDVGTMDDEDYIFIVDRVKDMINVAGFKVWPAEVERVLYGHPAMKEIAVLGFPDAVKGETVGAAIVLKNGASLSPDEVIAFCRERLAVYKAPSRVEFLTELPKSPSGKILKRILRARYSRSD